MSHDALNTHTYDGKLRDYRETIKKDLDRARGVAPAVKQEAFEVLRGALARAPETTPQTLRYLDQIRTAAATGRTAENYDSSNDLRADDILYLCYELYLNDTVAASSGGKPSDLLSILADQLHDMSTGPCPPGRTTRLFQVYVSLAAPS